MKFSLRFYWQVRPTTLLHSSCLISGFAVQNWHQSPYSYYTQASKGRMTRILSSFILLATLVILDASVYMSSPFDSPPMMSTGVNISSTMTRKVPQTPEELERDRIEKARRMEQRRANAREKIAYMQPNPSDLELLSPEEMERIYGMAETDDPNQDKEEYTWLRRLWGKKSTVDFDPYQPAGMANPGSSYGTLVISSTI
jgi:hypothetical protein